MLGGRVHSASLHFWMANSSCFWCVKKIKTLDYIIRCYKGTLCCCLTSTWGLRRKSSIGKIKNTPKMQYPKSSRRCNLVPGSQDLDMKKQAKSTETIDSETTCVQGIIHLWFWMGSAFSYGAWVVNNTVLTVLKIEWCVSCINS